MFVHQVSEFRGGGVVNKIVCNIHTQAWLINIHYCRKCFTNSENIREVVRCSFYSNPIYPCILPTNLETGEEGEPIHSICVRNSSSLRDSSHLIGFLISWICFDKRIYAHARISFCKKKFFQMSSLVPIRRFFWLELLFFKEICQNSENYFLLS